VFSKLWWSSGTIQVVERLAGGVMGVELTFLRCVFFFPSFSGFSWGNVHIQAHLITYRRLLRAMESSPFPRYVYYHIIDAYSSGTRT
jgi:hypothetical protein